MIKARIIEADGARTIEARKSAKEVEGALGKGRLAEARVLTKTPVQNEGHGRE